MEEWKKIYSDKIVTAAQAVKAIKGGDNLVLGHAAGVPQVIPAEMVKQKESFRDVKVFHMFTFGDGDYMNPELKDNFWHVTPFLAGNSRTAVAENRGDFLPSFFYEVPSLFKTVYPVDVAVIQVSEPDENGNCSFGVSCDYTKPAAENAKIVIAEINDMMPYVSGDNFIHISKIDYIVPVSQPLYELPLPCLGETEKAIGKNCASLVNDGDTLQLGIGAIPDAVLASLKNKKDLGLHSEMFSDGAIDLIESGVINGKCKTLHKGKIVTTFLMGSKRLYDFVNRNNDVEIYPVDYVNNPAVIGRNNNIVAINSCIEVDLMGQVNSESIGLKQFSGTGGQVDFVRGAAISEGGKSVMAMPATAAKGKLSRIVPFLAQGSAVTTSRNDVDYVVTEYGIAHLRGATLRERAKRLIAIAHPDFREELQKEFERRFS